MNVLDLFSGIGGFSLGLERAGFKTVAFCEIDPFCRRVLAKHWPNVPCYEDVRTLSAQHITADGLVPEVICGGFPCQDISVAGKGAGLAGERSGLWSEFARLIGELRPRYAIVENVSALLGRGLGTVLGDLSSIGYDAEWHCIPASAIGAPHRRDRVWIVAYPHGGGRGEQGNVGQAFGDAETGQSGDGGSGMVNANDTRCGELEESDARGGVSGEGESDYRTSCGSSSAIRLPSRQRLEIGPGALGEWAHAATTGTGWWATEPDVGRVVDGPAARVDRRKRLIALGNGLVPQIPELIGRAILAAEQSVHQ